MLSLLRKYQKVVFGLVASALIVSIAFFGSYGAMNYGTTKEKDRLIGSSIDGSRMSRLDINRMVRFLSTDRFDTEAGYRGNITNVFNPGVIRKDFIETGLAQMLVEEYFEDVKGDLSEKVERCKHFQSYSHPAAPYLSAENLYKQFLPSAAQKVAVIKSKDFELTPANFGIIAQVYAETALFSPNLVRRFLAYQQENYQGVPKDPYLETRDVSWLGCHEAEEWFGHSFIELIAQTIHNGAIYAKGKGYKVSLQEAKADLIKQGYDALTSYSKEEVSPELVGKYWKDTLGALRLNEREAVSVWQKVLLFKKLFDDYGLSVFVDKMTYDNYNAFLSEGAEVSKYALPQDLQIGDFLSLLKFQVYLEVVAKDKKQATKLDLPKEFNELNAIAKEAPELIEKIYTVDVAHVRKTDLAMDIPLKEMWDWQQQEGNWSKLRSEFEFLPLVAEEARLEVLDQLPEPSRNAVDKFSRNAMVSLKTDLIDKALDEAETEKKTLNLPLKGRVQELQGIESSSELMAALDSGAHKNYTQDQKNYYRFTSIEAAKEGRLLTFKEALSKGILDDLLNRKLQQHYEAAKKSSPTLFQNEQGQFKELTAVKELVGKFVYKDLLDAIEKDYVAGGGVLKVGSQKEPLEFYATHRLYHFVNQAKKDIETKGSDSLFLQEVLPYHLTVKQETVSRKENQAWVTDDLFEMQENAFSSLKVAPHGEISFCQMLKKTSVDDKQISSAMDKGQKLLSQDAKRELMTEMLKIFRDKDGIHLEKVIEQEES